MGSGSSQPQLEYRGAVPFKPPGSPELFRVNPEDLAFALEFSNDDTKIKHTQRMLRDTTIIDMCLHPNLFTNDPNVVNILKDVIMPILSGSLMKTEQLEPVEAFLTFVANRSKFYLEHHEKPEDSSENQNDQLPTQDADIEMPDSDSIKSFIRVTHGAFKLVPEYGKIRDMGPQLRVTVSRLWEQGKNQMEFLYCVFLWAIAVADPSLIVRVGVQCLTAELPKKTKMNVLKSDREFMSSIRYEHAIKFAGDQQTVDYIECMDPLPNGLQHKSIFVAGFDSVFLLVEENENDINLEKISLSPSVTDRLARFIRGKSRIRTRKSPFLVMSGNYVIVTTGIGGEIYTINPFARILETPHPYGAPPFSPVAASDGFYIYCLDQKAQGLNVFSVKENDGCAHITYHWQFALKFQNGPLKKDDPKSMQKQLAEGKVAMITNGIVVQFAWYLGEEAGQHKHQIRCFSLIDGSFVSEQIVAVPYVIHSWAYEPISNTVFVLAPYNQGSQILRAAHYDAQPPWIIGCEELVLDRTDVRSEKLSHKSITPESLANRALGVLKSVVTPYFGAKCVTTDSDENEVELMAPGNDRTIEMLCGDIAELRKWNPSGEIQGHSATKKKWISIALELLKLNLVRGAPDKRTAETVQGMMRSLVSEQCFRSELLLLTLECMDKIFKYCPSEIATWFPFVIGPMKGSQLLLTMVRCEKSRVFPYVFSREVYHMFFGRQLQQMRNNKVALDAAAEFFMNYQRVIFSALELRLESRGSDVKLFLEYASVLSMGIIEQMVLLLDSLTITYDEKNIADSLFIRVYRTFLLLIQPVISSHKFASRLTGDLKRLMHVFSVTLVRLDIDPYRQCLLRDLFVESFEVMVCSIRAIIGGSHKLNEIKQFLPLAQASLRLLQNSDWKERLGQDYDTLLRSLSPDLPPAKEIARFIYKKVNHPINRRMDDDDRGFEGTLFAAFCLHMQCLDDIATFYGNQDAPIPPRMKQIIQQIYKVRFDIIHVLRNRRQEGPVEDQPRAFIQHSDPYYIGVVEKCKFLLLLGSSVFVPQEQLSKFVSNESTLDDFLQTVQSVKPIQHDVLSGFDVLQDLLKMPNFPSLYFSVLLSAIVRDKSLYESLSALLQIVGRFPELGDRLVGTSQLISQLSLILPVSLVVACLCSFVLILSHVKDARPILAILNIVMKTVCHASSGVSIEECKSILAFTCYFIRDLKDRQIVEFTPEIMRDLCQPIQSIPVEYMLSFSTAHALLHAGFDIPRSWENCASLIPMVAEPEFHTLCLYLYEVLISDDDSLDRPHLLSHIINNIGMTLTGSVSAPFSQFPLVDQLDEEEMCPYCKTPGSQISGCLELVILLRRILVSNTKSGRALSAMISEIIREKDLTNKSSVIRLVAVMNIIADVMKNVRPYSLVRAVNDGKTYYVTSIDERKRTLEGVLLPVAGDCIVETVSLDSVLDPRSIFPFDWRSYDQMPALSELVKSFLDRPMKVYSDCLLSFFALNCLKAFVLEQEDGSHFATRICQELPSCSVTSLVFRGYADAIVGLLNKSLVHTSGGIFVGSPVKPQFYHTGFTQIVIKGDYTLTGDTFASRNGTQIFVSSILDDQYPIFVAFSVGLQSDLDFGVVTHAVDRNRVISVMYSTEAAGFILNGELVGRHRCISETMEMKYDPKKHKVSFASSNSSTRLFSYRLPNELCSFMITVKNNCRVSYKCSLNPTTKCMAKKLAARDVFRPTKFLHKVGRSLFGKKTDETKVAHVKKCTLIDVNETTERKDLGYMKLHLNGSPDIKANPGNEPVSAIAEFADVRLLETNVGTALNTPVSWTSRARQTICSSPVRSENYFDVSDIDGRCLRVSAADAKMSPISIIPPFHYTTFQHIPAEILNCYFSGACELHRREVITTILTRLLTDPRNDISRYREFFKLSMEMILDYIIHVLVLVEPLNFENLKENGCPVAFNVNAMTSSYVCSRSELHDSHYAAMALLNYVTSDAQICREFVNLWKKRVNEMLQDKYSHFVTKECSEAIIVHSCAVDRPRQWSRNDVTGWIAFPLAFGLRRLPRAMMLRQEFPPENGPFTYAYVPGTSFSIKLPEKGIQWAIIPISSVTNEGFMGTFIESVITMKYYAIFLGTYKGILNTADVLEAKIFLRRAVFRAIIAGSPFFYSHDSAVLSFLGQTVPLACTELNDDFTKSLSIFVAATSTIPHTGLVSYVEEQRFLIDDQQSAKYRPFFPEFSDSGAAPETGNIPEMPPKMIPGSLCRLQLPSLLNAKRVLTPCRTIVGFPFHLILRDWAYAFARFPDVDITIEAGSLLSIHFVNYVPSRIRISEPSLNPSTQFTVNFTRGGTSTVRKSLDDEIATGGSDLFLQFDEAVNITDRHFVVWVAPVQGEQHLMNQNRGEFVSDMREMLLHWSTDDDQKILVQFPVSNYNRPSVDPRLSPIDLAVTGVRKKTRLLYLRAQLLICFNYFCVQFRDQAAVGLSGYKHLLSVLLSTGRFKESILAKSTGGYEYLTINRRAGLEVRSGLSSKLENSMIAQFAHRYEKSTKWRSADRPFHIEYLGENGIDVGGLARDFASELVKDINEPRVGLFVITPNGHNRVGSHRECRIPIPDPRLAHPERMYQAVGGLLAMGVRVGLTQPYNFPPVFWEYLAGGEITVEHIYDIDENYRLTMTSLTDALASGMTAETFNRTFNQDSVVVDLRGERKPVGGSGKVTYATCSRYIADCQRMLISQLETPMRWIRDGFWNNLDLSPRIPDYITPQILEFMVCGKREIDVRDLKAKTEFRDVPRDQIAMFWDAVSRMTNDQKRMLLQFSTGTMSIPHDCRGFLVVDFIRTAVDSRLPTASTCFYRLHLPPFSSADKMYRALVTAAEYTGSFENS